MQPLADRQHGFAEALLDPRSAVPAGLVGPDGKPSTLRFNVYRNNVFVGLAATLKDAFPAVARLVGDEFFAAMARVYVAEAPPRSPLMFDYGFGFADFIEGFEPAAMLPYLSDVARVERAWVEAYHACEAQSLDVAAFTAIASHDLPNIRIALHPSLRVVRSKFPVLTLWQMNIAGGTPAHIATDACGEDVVIVRPDAIVEARSLPAGGAEFVLALVAGSTVLDAVGQAMAADDRFDLAINLAGLMQAQAFVDFELAARGFPDDCHNDYNK